MKANEFKDGLIDVSVVSNDGNGVEFKCVIQKTVLMNMFSEYDFKRTVESFLAKRIVDELPIEQLNELRKKIDLDTVAKLGTVYMAESVSGRNNRN